MNKFLPILLALLLLTCSKDPISDVGCNTDDFGFGKSSFSMSGGAHKRKIRTIQNIRRKFNRN